MGLIFKNIKQLQAIKSVSRSKGLQSKSLKKKSINIKLTRKSKLILKQLGFQLKQNA
jgi:hypothetical protein